MTEKPCDGRCIDLIYECDNPTGREIVAEWYECIECGTRYHLTTDRNEWKRLATDHQKYAANWKYFFKIMRQNFIQNRDECEKWMGLAGEREEELSGLKMRMYSLAPDPKEQCDDCPFTDWYDGPLCLVAGNYVDQPSEECKKACDELAQKIKGEG